MNLIQAEKEILFGQSVRLVEERGKKWAVLKDENGHHQDYLLISELGVLWLVFKSRKPKAATFQEMLIEIFADLEGRAGLDEFAVFQWLGSGE